MLVNMENGELACVFGGHGGGGYVFLCVHFWCVTVTWLCGMVHLRHGQWRGVAHCAWRHYALHGRLFGMA